MANEQPAVPDELRISVAEGLEEDDLGVYEVWWHANSVLPDWSLSARLRASEVLVEELLRDGVVTMWRGRWIGPEHDREEVEAASQPEVLREWSSWVPQNDEVIWLRYAGPG